MRVTVTGPHIFVRAAVHIVSNMITGAFNVEITRSSTFMFHHESHGVSPTPAIYQTKITARALTPGTKGEDQDPPPAPHAANAPRRYVFVSTPHYML